MSLILGFSVEYLFRVYTLSIVETNIAILSFVFEIEMLFELIETIEHFLALVKWAIVTSFVLDLLGHMLVRVIVVRIFL